MRVRRSDCSVTLVVGSVVPNIIPVSAIIPPPHDNHRPCYRHHLRHNHHHFQHHRQPSPLPEVLFSILVYSHFGSSQALLKQCLVPIENKGEMGMGRDSRERVLMAFSSQRPHGGGARCHYVSFWRMFLFGWAFGRRVRRAAWSGAHASVKSGAARPSFSGVECSGARRPPDKACAALVCNHVRFLIWINQIVLTLVFFSYIVSKIKL